MTLNSSKEYVFCAIRNHKEENVFGGHYVAEAMDWATGMWFEYDDENVSFLLESSDCSFEPEFREQDSKEKDHYIDEISNESVKGSSDAFNLFYVEKYIYAKGAKEHIKTLTMSTLCHSITVIRNVIYVVKIMKEKEEFQNSRAS